VRHSLPIEGSVSRHPLVLIPQPGMVRILLDHDLYTSLDNGVTLQAPYKLPLRPTTLTVSAVVGPNGGITEAENTGQIVHIGADASEPAQRVTLDEALVGLGYNDPSLALDEGGRPVLFSSGYHDPLYTFTWNGTGDINSAASWIRGPTLRQTGGVEAAGGPSGVWFAYIDATKSARTGDHWDVTVRQLRNGRFGRKRTIYTRGGPLELHLAQTATGDLVVAWPGSTRRGRPALLWAYRNGRRWHSARILTTLGEPDDIVVAQGGGWMVWDGDTHGAIAAPIHLLAIPRLR
jgi:hypothetical protein